MNNHVDGDSDSVSHTFNSSENFTATRASCDCEEIEESEGTAGMRCPFPPSLRKYVTSVQDRRRGSSEVGAEIRWRWSWTKGRRDDLYAFVDMDNAYDSIQFVAARKDLSKKRHCVIGQWDVLGKNKHEV